MRSVYGCILFHVLCHLLSFRSFFRADMSAATLRRVAMLAVALFALCSLSRAQQLYVAAPAPSVFCHHAMRIDWDAARGSNKHLPMDTGGNATFSLVRALATPWVLLLFGLLAVSLAAPAPPLQHHLVGVATIFSATAVAVTVSCLRPCLSRLCTGTF